MRGSEKTMVELGRSEEVIREMDKLANEDHTHISTEEELNFYRSIWWKRSNFVGSDTMLSEASTLISNKRCQLCVASRMKRIKLITKIGGKALPRLGGNGKILGGIPHLRHHRDEMDLTLMERENLRKTVNGLFIRGMSLKTNLVQKLQ